jgi:transposase
MTRDRLVSKAKPIDESDFNRFLERVDKEEHKKAFSLMYYEGISLRDVTKKLNIPRSTLQHKLSRLSKWTMLSLKASYIRNMLNKGHSLSQISDKLKENNKRQSEEEYKKQKQARKGIDLRTRWLVLKRDNFKCRACGRDSNETILSVDHINSIKNGGDNNLDNYQTLCRDCNLGKGKESYEVKYE